MLKLDIWNIVWTIVNILVLYAIFRKFLFQPVLKVIQDRENMIKDQIDNAQKVTDDANQLKSDYEKKLEVAKDEADKIIVDDIDGNDNDTTQSNKKNNTNNTKNNTTKKNTNKNNTTK